MTAWILVAVLYVLGMVMWPAFDRWESEYTGDITVNGFFWIWPLMVAVCLVAVVRAAFEAKRRESERTNAAK